MGWNGIFVMIIIYLSIYLSIYLYNRNYGRSSVMTYQTFSLTEQTFPEIGRNEQSLSDTIWTLDHDKYSAKIFLDKPIYKLLPKTTRFL